MIKNIKDLNEKEIESFKNQYFEYFQDLSVMKMKSETIANIKKNLLKSRSMTYVNTMLERINSGARIGYAYVVDDETFGFIVGRVYSDDKTGWISHIYIDNSVTALQKRTIILEMYRALSQDFKKAGVTKVTSEVSYFNPKELDALETLDFSLEEEYHDNSVLYGKKL